VLLWRFHGADGGGRCFPSYEKIASAAKCCRDSVCVALAALEDAGLLTWVHRLARIRHRERDHFGQWGSRWQVIRTSNGYQLLDPLARGPGRRSWFPYKSENPTGPQNQDFKRTKAIDNLSQRDGARLAGARAIQDLLGETSNGTALGSWSSAEDVAAALLRNPRSPT
jgi:hypothetical protein